MSSNKSATSIDKHVGAKVRMGRLMLGFSQTDLAGGLGVKYQQVQKYENGTTRVSASRLQQIAGVLKVEPSFFFEGAPGPTAKATGARGNACVTEFLASKDGLALAKAFMSIKDRQQRRRVVDLAKRIAKGG